MGDWSDNLPVVCREDYNNSFMTDMSDYDEKPKCYSCKYWRNNQCWCGSDYCDYKEIEDET